MVSKQVTLGIWPTYSYVRGGGNDAPYIFKFKSHVQLYLQVVSEYQILVAPPLQNCSDFLKFYFKIHFKRACQVLLFSLDVVVLVKLSI